MDVVNSVASAAVVGNDQGTTKPVLSSDFETFLKMLTVQLENQDPLNPVDSADYAVQLATFSGVEQQVQTNYSAGSRMRRTQSLLVCLMPLDPIPCNVHLL